MWAPVEMWAPVSGCRLVCRPQVGSRVVKQASRSPPSILLTYGRRRRRRDAPLRRRCGQGRVKARDEEAHRAVSARSCRCDARHRRGGAPPAPRQLVLARSAGIDSATTRPNASRKEVCRARRRERRHRAAARANAVVPHVYNRHAAALLLGYFEAWQGPSSSSCVVSVDEPINSTSRGEEGGSPRIEVATTSEREGLALDGPATPPPPAAARPIRPARETSCLSEASPLASGEPAASLLARDSLRAICNSAPRAETPSAPPR